MIGQAEAASEARALQDKLRQSLGRGWTVRVWENIGWHWEVRSADGRLRFGPGISARELSLFYYDNGGPYSGIQHHAYGRSPSNMLRRVLRDLERREADTDALLHCVRVGAAAVRRRLLRSTA